MAGEWVLVGDIVILLATCLLFGGILSRLGHSPLVGYLLAGIVLAGPGSMQVISSKHEIEQVAELGVALLLFSLGLEFSVGRLIRLGPKPLIGGVAQVTVSIVITALVARALHLSWGQSLALGAMLSLSSTAVVLRILLERSELDTPHGRNSLAVLLTQDIAVVPLAILMTILDGSTESGDMAWQLVRLGGSAIGLVVLFYIIDQIAVFTLGMLTLHRHRELAVILAVVTGLGAAWAAHRVGISPALGAFIAGMLLGSSAFATQIRADVSSLRVVLLTLFFGAAGMVADPLWMLRNWIVVLAVTLTVLIGKTAIVWTIFRILGHPTRIAAATGLTLAQVGEFAFVLGSIGRSGGIVSDDLYSLTVSVTIVLFVLSGFLVPMAPRFGGWIASWIGANSLVETQSTDESPKPDLVVVGFGPVAQLATQSVLEKGLTIIVIDLNRDNIKRARERGFHGIVGDATQVDVLEHASIHHAQAVLITIPHVQSALHVLETVRYLAPDATTFVRSRYQRYTEEFTRSGADYLVGDEEQVGKGLGVAVTDWFNQLEAEESIGRVNSDHE